MNIKTSLKKYLLVNAIGFGLGGLLWGWILYSELPDLEYPFHFMAIIPPVLEPNRVEEEIVVLEEPIKIMPLQSPEIIPILEPEPEIIKVVEEEIVAIEKKIEIVEEGISVQPELPYSVPFFIGGGGPPPEPESEPEPEPEIIIDSTPPSSISNLLATTGDNRGEINLSWTAPGDDGLIGTSTEYLIKYSTSSEITSDNWASSTDFVNEIVPSISGSAENLLISGLDVNKIYYWAIKSKDEVDNFSEISNCASISPQAKADGLVISEVQIKGSSVKGDLANDEFIEIYNPTDSDIDLSDWSIQYRGSGSVNFYKKNFVNGNSIPAKGYFLITNDGYNGHMTADMSHDSFQISATGGNIFLINNQIDLINTNGNSIIDKIAYGSGDNLFPETLEFDLVPEANQSLERKNTNDSTAESLAVNGNEHWQGNNWDSNNNNNDFVLQSNPNPQNSLTLTEPRDSFANLADTAWPILQHDLQHTGLSPYSNNATGSPTSTHKWMVSLGLNSLSSPVIDFDGFIYVGGGSKLYKVNPEDGQFELFYDTQTNYSIKSPVIDSSGNFYFTDTCYLYALNSNGQLIWKYPIYNSSEPVIASDSTIYIADSYYLYALTPNGEKIWQSEQLSNGNWVRSPVIDSDGDIYTVGRDGSCSNCKRVYALNFENGNILWKTELGPYSTALSMDNKGTLFVGGDLDSGSSGLYALYSLDGSQKWYGSTGDITYSIPAITEDTIYVGADNHAFYAVNKPDGGTNIIFFSSQRIIASPVIDKNGIIYIGGSDNMFYAINPDKTIKWLAELIGNIYKGAVISSDGTVYVVTLDGNLYAFGE